MVLMLAFTKFSELSTLEEELERLKLDVWFALTLPLTRFRELSTLEDELERLTLEV